MNQNLAQEQLENQKPVNVFYEYVKNYFNENSHKYSEFEGLLDIENLKSLNYDDFKMFGILCFVTGVDYFGQSYYQKDVLENVTKRFVELGISRALKSSFKYTILQISKSEELTNEFVCRCNYFEKLIQNEFTNEIDLPILHKGEFVKIRAKINSIINQGNFPIKFAHSINDLKTKPFTWESILQLNTLLQEYGIFNGSITKELTTVYGNEIFIHYLKLATDKFNEIKYSILLKESIISLIETTKRLDSIVFNPDIFTDVEYERFKTEHENLIVEPVETIQKDNNVFRVQDWYDDSALKMIYANQPDKFIETILKDVDNSYFLGTEATKDVVQDDFFRRVCILCEESNSDLAQNIYQYLRANINKNRRPYRHSFQMNDFVVEELETRLNEIKEKYRELVEKNCADIPSHLNINIVNKINSLIEDCVLETQEQKQYLVSQLIENGITTWNHFQQTLSLIETCNINGKAAGAYVELTQYIEENVDISDIFNNSELIPKLEIKMAIYKAFKDWYSIEFSDFDEGAECCDNGCDNGCDKECSCEENDGCCKCGK